MNDLANLHQEQRVVRLGSIPAAFQWERSFVSLPDHL